MICFYCKISKEIINYHYSLRIFQSSVSWWFFTEVVSDRKSSQISRTFPSILTDLNNDVVSTFSTRPLISKSFINRLVTVPRAPITTVINVTFMYYIFFSVPYQCPGTYPSFHFLLILLYGQSGQQSPQFFNFFFFWVFHISVSRWFSTGVWVTASLLKSPGLVSGFWPFLTMLSFG